MRIPSGTREDVAISLIHRAKQGMLEVGNPGNAAYQRSCDTYHEPTNTSIALTREILPGPLFGIASGLKAWHLSISFTDGYNGIQAFDASSASEWLRVVFGTMSSQLKVMRGINSENIRHYLLLCPGDFIDLARSR